MAGLMGADNVPEPGTTRVSVHATAFQSYQPVNYTWRAPAGLEYPETISKESAGFPKSDFGRLLLLEQFTIVGRMFREGVHLHHMSKPKLALTCLEGTDESLCRRNH